MRNPRQGVTKPRRKVAESGQESKKVLVWWGFQGMREAQYPNRLWYSSKYKTQIYFSETAILISWEWRRTQENQSISNSCLQNQCLHAQFFHLIYYRPNVVTVASLLLWIVPLLVNQLVLGGNLCGAVPPYETSVWKGLIPPPARGLLNYEHGLKSEDECHQQSSILSSTWHLQEMWQIEGNKFGDHLKGSSKSLLVQSIPTLMQTFDGFTSH